VAQNITSQIKNAAKYLIKKSLDVYCLEFKYFVNNNNEKVLTIDIILGNDIKANNEFSVSSLQTIDRKAFIYSLDENGKEFFQNLLDYAKSNSLPIHWGSKGFSLNVNIEGISVMILCGFPPNSVYSQCIHIRKSDIIKKVEGGEEIASELLKNIEETDYFKKDKSDIKWLINKPFSNEMSNNFHEIIQRTVNRIKETGLKNAIHKSN